MSYSHDNLVPYAGHKRLTVVTLPPKVYSTRPSILQREYDRIESKLRPWTGYSAVNRYLNSDSAVVRILEIFLVFKEGLDQRLQTQKMTVFVADETVFVLNFP